MTDAAIQPAEAPRPSRAGLAGLLLGLALGLLVLAFIVGVALGMNETSDTTLAWMPLILPYAAMILVGPLLVAATVVGIVSARRTPRGRAAAIVIAVVSGLLALIAVPLGLMALFGVVGYAGSLLAS